MPGKILKALISCVLKMLHHYFVKMSFSFSSIKKAFIPRHPVNALKLLQLQLDQWNHAADKIRFVNHKMLWLLAKIWRHHSQVPTLLHVLTIHWRESRCYVLFPTTSFHTVAFQTWLLSWLISSQTWRVSRLLFSSRHGLFPDYGIHEELTVQLNLRLLDLSKVSN